METIQALVEKIELCDFECVAGPLTMSNDWLKLRSLLSQLPKEGEVVVKPRAILTPCPSCGVRALFIGDSGDLVCGWLECKDPSAAYKAMIKEDK